MYRFNSTMSIPLTTVVHETKFMMFDRFNIAARNVNRRHGRVVTRYRVGKYVFGPFLVKVWELSQPEIYEEVGGSYQNTSNS